MQFLERITYVGLSTIIFAVPALSDTIAERAQDLADTLFQIEKKLSTEDADYIERQLDRLLDVTKEYESSDGQGVFRFTFSDTTLNVYAKDTGNLLQTWYKHDRLTTRGPVLGLLDSAKEFMALRYENGVKTELVKDWHDVVDYVIHDNYIGLVDKNGIAEIWSSREKKELVNDWKNTIKYHFDRKFIVFLDNEADKNLNVYDSAGRLIIDLKGVSSFDINDRYVLNYQQGVGKVLDIRDYL